LGSGLGCSCGRRHPKDNLDIVVVDFDPAKTLDPRDLR
jgi:hypothetical protein